MVKEDLVSLQHCHVSVHICLCPNKTLKSFVFVQKTLLQSRSSCVMLVQKLTDYFQKWYLFFVFTPASYTLCTDHCCNLWTSFTGSELCFSQQMPKPSLLAVHISRFCQPDMWEWLFVLLVRPLLLYLSLLIFKPLLLIWTWAHPNDVEHVWNTTTGYGVEGGKPGNTCCTDKVNLSYDWRQAH